MAGGLQQVLVLPGFPSVYRECLPEVFRAVQEGEGCEGEDRAVNGEERSRRTADVLVVVSDAIVACQRQRSSPAAAACSSDSFFPSRVGSASTLR